MKHKDSVRIIAITAILSIVATLFGVSVQKAYASSCFTDTGAHWAETFICWMKTMGLSSGYPDGSFRPDNTISRAEVAALLYKLMTSGNTYINNSLSDWKTNDGNENITLGSGAVVLDVTTSGAHRFVTFPTLPGTLNGAQQFLKGVLLCRDTSVGASITQVDLQHWLITDTSVPHREVINSTVTVGIGCTEYDISSPDRLLGSDSVELLVTGSFAATSDHLTILSTTFVLFPGATPGSLTLPSVLPLGPNR